MRTRITTQTDADRKKAEKYKAETEKIKNEVDAIFNERVLPVLEKFMPKHRCKKVMAKIKFEGVQYYFSNIGQTGLLSEDIFRCKLHEAALEEVLNNVDGQTQFEKPLYEIIDEITPALYQQVCKRNAFTEEQRSSVFV